MKQIFLVILVATAFSLRGQTAAAQAVLEVTYSIELVVRQDRPAIPDLDKVGDVLAKVEAVLLCNNSSAYSSIPYPFDMGDWTEGLARILAGAGHAFYTDMAAPSMVMEVSEGDDRLLVEHGVRIEWVIDETMTAEISGIRCVYAEGTIPAEAGNMKDERVAAWFAPDYPLPFGPQGLHGLPGLIVKAERSGKGYMVKRIRNIADQKVKVPTPGRGKRISFAEFLKY